MTDGQQSYEIVPRSGVVNWVVDRLPLILGLLSLPLAVIALFYALNTSDQVIYEAGAIQDDGQSAEVAQRALERTQENNDSLDTVLSLLEVGLALLGATITVAAVVFTVNVLDIRSDLENRADQYEKQVDQRLSSRESELNRIATELGGVGDATKAQIKELSQATEGQIERLSDMIKTELNQARDAAERSFKVLSKQLLAEQQVRARNYKTAIEELEDAYELEPENQTTNYLLGYLYITRRRFDDALMHLNQALQINPDFAPALAALGLAQRRIGDKSEAVEDRNENWAQAEVNLLHALKVDPNLLDGDGESYFGTLGGLYRRQNRHEDALHAYQKAVQVTPRSSYPTGNLAVLYKYTGRDEEANDTYTDVIEIASSILEDNPSDHWARLDKALALLVIGNKEAALREYENLIAREPSPGALDAGASTLEFLRLAPSKINGLDEAIKLLRDAAS